jgi:hypothetical protein
LITPQQIDEQTLTMLPRPLSSVRPEVVEGLRDVFQQAFSNLTPRRRFAYRQPEITRKIFDQDR